MAQERSTAGALREPVVEEIKERIIDGRLPTGARLHERNLSAELGVSRVPVREAILTLASEGLVDVSPRIGAFVRPLSRSYIADLFEVRLAIEPLAASLAAQRRTDEQLGELERLCAAEEAALHTDDPRQGSLVNAQIHLALLRASGNDLLYSLMAPLHSQIQRLFRRTIAEITGDLLHDHEDLLAALRSQDAAKAAEIARRHVEDTRAHSLAYADE